MPTPFIRTPTVPLVIDPRKISEVATAHLSDEEFAQYVSFINRMMDHLKPVGDEEERLARSVAELMIAMDRMANLEIEASIRLLDPTYLAENPGKTIESSLKVLLALNRHQDSLRRDCDSDQKKLNRLQKARQKSRSRTVPRRDNGHS